MTDLYSTHAKEFSDTRQAPWPGWLRMLDVVSKTLVEKNQTSNIKRQTFNVLDLGCGNGRFLKYVKSHLPAANNNSIYQRQAGKLKIKSYTGIDNSEELLEIARNETRDSNFKTSFLNIDLEDSNWVMNLAPGTYNLITCFGVMHHLHTFEQRKNIYKSAYKLLDQNGIFCVTFWQFLKSGKLKVKSQKLKSINDYIVPFGNKGAERFVHFTDDEEIKKLEEGIDFELIDEYYSDGKEGNQNLYKIYRKN